MSFAFATTAWGAYPGHPVTDIQSGRGFVGNAFLFAHPQKSVVRGPFVARPTPAWFVTNRHAGSRHAQAPRLRGEALVGRSCPGSLAAAMRR